MEELIKPLECKESFISLTFGQRVCQILDIEPSKVGKITIEIAPNELVKVYVERYLFTQEGEEMLKQLEEFRLEAK